MKLKTPKIERHTSENIITENIQTTVNPNKKFQSCKIGT